MLGMQHNNFPKTFRITHYLIKALQTNTTGKVRQKASHALPRLAAHPARRTAVRPQGPSRPVGRRVVAFA